MSKWLDAALTALSAADTLDTVDTVTEGTGAPALSVNTVNSVRTAERADSFPIPPASPDQAEDELRDRAAVAADCWPANPPQHPPPPAELVERLAKALAAPRPWQRVTDPVQAADYFAGEARRRLARLDPLSRGLLVAACEREAARWTTR